MATSTEQINDLIAGYTGLKNFFEGQADTWQGQVDDAAGSFAAMAANLKGVVSSELYFAATIDPDDIAPTNERGGVFNTIKEAVDAAPRGAFVRLTLLSGKSYIIPEVIACGGKFVRLLKGGDGANPAIVTTSTLLNDENVFRVFTSDGQSGVSIVNVNISLPTVLADISKPASLSRTSFFEYLPGGRVEMSLSGCTVTGGMAEMNMGLMSGHAGCLAMLGLSETVLDGNFFGVAYVHRGGALIRASTVTLANGASLQDGGTLGTDMLVG